MEEVQVVMEKRLQKLQMVPTMVAHPKEVAI